MTPTQWIGVAILSLVFAFAAFAVRQGTKVKPEEGKDPFGGIPGGGGEPPPT